MAEELIIHLSIGSDEKGSSQVVSIQNSGKIQVKVM